MQNEDSFENLRKDLHLSEQNFNTETLYGSDLMQINKPFIALQLMALLRRSPAKDRSHPKHSIIIRRLKRVMGGFRGEESVFYQLNYLPKEQFLILHGPRLSNENTYFQIDFLVLSPHFYTIIEVKNIYGELYFDPVFDQLIRKMPDGTQTGLQDPTSQVKIQKMQLRKWLKHHKLPIAPIKYLITVSDPKTILNTSLANHNISNWIIHKHALMSKFEHFIKANPKEIISNKDVKKIARKIKRKNEPLLSDVLDTYKFTPSQITSGVSCPKCLELPIPRHKYRKNWVCPTCRASSNQAYFEAIADYALLINNTFSNRQMRLFLHIDSDSTVYNLLKKMNIQTVGRKHSISLDDVYMYANKNFNE
ncbi:nuclease-related domain-containing protein [Pseudalkalibacillus berkeleyi]|uniref:NERD domain-containing protein n=1 Tax=Pseudalkalibacillus berkeleyi TaxID=1069813 RepID=A0ABS9GVD1_9BACL|nr:nuclease-related domain-containing protein [Pseudalkalibacillus berkeleyi]MCF6136789.1 NERD domain-containing protein [Pseudalkalibacillus berkeleyi]